MIWRRNKTGKRREAPPEGEAAGEAPGGTAPQEAEARQAEVAAAPTNPRLAIIGGLVVLAVTFGGFGTWAAVAQLSSAVVSQGTVKVLSNRKKVQHLEGGIVREIKVRNGDRVKEGDVLLRLDQTQASARADIINSRYYTVRAAIARLQAERDNADEIAFPAELEKRRSEPAIREVLEGQEKLFEARRATLNGELELLEERVGQLEEEIRGLKAEVGSRSSQITLIRDELEGLRKLHEKGYAPRTRLLALEREEARLRGERGSQEARIARARRLIGETRLKIIQTRQAWQERVITQLREHQSQVMDLQERKHAADVWLTRTDVRATATGTVVGMNVHAQGQVLQPGETILEIVPSEDRLIVEAAVRPVDRDEVLVGQAADVAFTAFSQRTTPKLKGEVIYVSADSMTDEKTGATYYVARIAVPDEEVKRLGGRSLQPGMPANVFIKTGARTPLDYLLKPLTESLSHAWRES
ncbi:MAG: HlyD family type I secretion periplasmic adaptor subunit [Alphaproteobacteria bacterium]